MKFQIGQMVEVDGQLFKVDGIEGGAYSLKPAMGQPGQPIRITDPSVMILCPRNYAVFHFSTARRQWFCDDRFNQLHDAAAFGRSFPRPGSAEKRIVVDLVGKRVVWKGEFCGRAVPAGIDLHGIPVEKYPEAPKSSCALYPVKRTDAEGNAQTIFVSVPED